MYHKIWGFLLKWHFIEINVPTAQPYEVFFFSLQMPSIFIQLRAAPQETIDTTTVDLEKFKIEEWFSSEVGTSTIRCKRLK